jgi:hypothetical protein
LFPVRSGLTVKPKSSLLPSTWIISLCANGRSFVPALSEPPLIQIFYA